MPQQLLTQTTGQEGSALALNGRKVVEAHAQLTGIIKSRLGQRHAEYLARPALEPTGAIKWSTHLTGAVKLAGELPDEDREKLERTASRLVNDIRGLAAQMLAESPATRLVGQMLERVAQVAPGVWLYSVDGKPVTAMWGHGGASIATANSGALPGAAMVVPAQGVPSRALAADGPVDSASISDVIDVASRELGSGFEPSSPASSAPVVPRTGGDKRWLRWLSWGLLALLLLALLLFGLKRCTGASGPAAPSAVFAEAALENQQLVEEIARRKSQRSQYQCLPEPVKPLELAASQAEPSASEQEPTAVTPSPKPSAPSPAASKPQPSTSKSEPPASIPQPPISKAAAAPSPEPPPPPVQQAKCKPPAPGDEPEVVMIVDASGSMNERFGGTGSRLDAAKRAADAMIRGLPKDVQVGLVDFVACGQVRRDKFYTGSERGALIGEINGLSPSKGTPLAAAIRRAGTIATDSADGVVVIVSDGDDSCGGDPCAEARALKAKKPNLIINVIDLSGGGKDRQVLQCVASAGGGRLLSPGDPLELSGKMKEAVTAVSCR